eukprot:3102479-Lingulodinium_polyedra.AAC.1
MRLVECRFSSGVGCRALAVGRRLLVVGCWAWVVGRRSPVGLALRVSRLPVVGRRLSVVGR